jgi:hypothetical protein
MREILSFVLLIITSTLHGQTKNGLKENELRINTKSVNRICIAAYCSPNDSCRGTPYQLNNTMAEDLIERLNKSNSRGPCIYYPEYLLHIYFKNGTQRDFRINGSSIKEINDWCFDINDSDYFKNLWIELDKIWIESNKR